MTQKRARCDRLTTCSAEVRCLKALVATAFSIREQDLAAPSRRKAKAAFARQVAMYLAHVSLGMSLGRVAREFGRDRSTAAYACRKVEDCRDDGDLDYGLERLDVAARLWAARSAEPAGVHYG